MMEQEEQGVRDVNARGVIELTAGSPGPSLSTATSGYSSCDDCSGPTSPDAAAVVVQKVPIDRNNSDVIARVLPAEGKQQRRSSVQSNSWLGDFDLTVFSDLGSGGDELVGQPQVAPPSSTAADLKDVRTVTNILNAPPATTNPNPVATWDTSLGDLDPGVEMMDVDVDTEDNTDHRQLLVSLLNRGNANPETDTSLIQPSIGTGSLSLSLDEFPPSMATDSITDDLAFKFADNVMSQQINESLFKYLGEMDPMSSALSLESLTDVGTGAGTSLTDNLLNDVNMCTTAQPLVRCTSPALATQPQPPALATTPPPPSIMSSHIAELGTSPSQGTELPSLLLNSPLRGASSSVSPTSSSISPPSRPQPTPPSTAVFRGLDDHSYTTKTGPSPGHHNRSQKPCSSLLEHFLTTKSRINPQKGSDYIIAQEAMSALKLRDERNSNSSNGNGHNNHNSNLLKQLLTGDIDKHGQASSSRASRTSAAESLSPLESPVAGDLDLLGAWSPPPPPPPSRRQSYRQQSTEVYNTFHIKDNLKAVLYSK